ncbi:MAG: alpha/beta hydrolase [Streptosporangiaceae bacterium]
MALRADTIAVDGAELHYQSTGRGPAVLAIGGAGAGVLEFRRLARRLAREFQVISYDRRGTLQSTGRADRPLDFGQESRDIATLLDALDVGPTILFATCGGASAGFDFSSRYPGRVRAYIIHEPLTIAILPDAVEQRAFFQGLCDLNERRGIVTAYRAWTRAIGVDSQPTFGPRSMARAKRDGDYVFRHHVMPMVDFRPDLAAIRQAGTPTAVAVGDGSLAGDYRQVRISRAMAAELACDLVTFPGHHHAYEDRPDEFATALTETISTF